MKVNLHIGEIASGIEKAAIKEIVSRDYSENIIVIAPEQMTMDVQLNLVKAHKNHCIGNISVLSFTRLAYMVNNEKTKDRRALLNDISKNILVSKLLNLPKYQPLSRKVSNRNALLSSMRRFFMEISRYDVNNSDYKKNLEALDDEYLAEKFSLALELYEDYKAMISADYSASETSLEALIKNGYSSDFLKGSIVYILGFAGFTPIQFSIIDMLLSKSKELALFFITDEKSLNNTDENTNLYYETMMSFSGISEILERVDDLELEKNLHMPKPLAPEREALLRALFLPESVDYSNKTEDIFLSDFASRQKEVDGVVAKLAKMVREGRRYRDFTIYISDLASYEKKLGDSLKKAGIPFYLDSKKGFSDNDASSFLFLLLELYLRNFDSATVGEYIKNYFSIFNEDELYYFENYVLAYGFRGVSLYGEEWTYRVPHLDKSDALNEEVLAKLNNLRAKFFGVFSAVNFKSKDSVAGHVEKLSKLLDLHEFEFSLATRADEFAASGDAVKSDTYLQIYKKVSELLEQIKIIGADEIVDFEDFVHLLKEGKKNLEIANVPSYVDEVLVAELSKSKVGERPVSFVLGLNDGFDLKVDGAAGFLNDYEREKLEAVGIRLAPIQKKKNILERFYIYRNITNFSEKLFLSYVNNDEAGNKLHKSYTLKEISAIFPSISSYKEELELDDYISTEELLFEKVLEDSSLLEMFSEEDMSSYIRLKKNAKFDMDSFLSKDSINLIFGKSIVSSISRLEKYASCPQAFFINYILGARERKLADINMPDVGNAGHFIFENIVNEVNEKNIDYASLGIDTIDAMLEELSKKMLASDEFKSFGYNWASKGHFNRIKRKVASSLNIMSSQIAQGSFRPIKTELNFFYDKDGGYALSDGRHLKLTGKIDRVDAAEIGVNKYLSVLDYKTTEKTLDFAKVDAGLSLQLMVYMSMASRIMGGKPAGMQYFPIERKPNAKTSIAGMTEKERLSANKMISYIVDNEDVIRAYDRDFQDSSVVLGIRRKKDGSFSTNKSSMIIGEGELSDMLSSLDDKLVSLGDEILSGDMSARPFKYGSETGCKYCNYKDICKFNEKIDENKFKVIEKLT